MMEINDIVQIVDASDHWYPALLIVSEVKIWGVQAYCFVPSSNVENKTMQAYRRLKNEKIKKVGHAEIVEARHQDENGNEKSYV